MKEMKKDILMIKTDIGMIVDILIAIFVAEYINVTAGIILFIVGLVFEIYAYVRDCIKLKYTYVGLDHE